VELSTTLHRKKREYEAMYLIRPDVEEDLLNSIVEKVGTSISENEGEIMKTARWSKRYLAYPINDYKEGYYVIVRFMGNNKSLTALDYILRFTPEIMRSLVTFCKVDKRQLRARARRERREVKK
jgi:small subunit ribosomal protein S6